MSHFRMLTDPLRGIPRIATDPDCVTTDDLARIIAEVERCREALLGVAERRRLYDLGVCGLDLIRDPFFPAYTGPEEVAR